MAALKRKASLAVDTGGEIFQIRMMLSKSKQFTVNEVFISAYHRGASSSDITSDSTLLAQMRRRCNFAFHVDLIAAAL